MLNQGTVFAVVAVKDIEKAKEFYGGTLGLSILDENMAGVMYSSGTGKVFVYTSAVPGVNSFTSASWEVDDIEAVVTDLKNKGISFEKYDLPGATMEGDIHVFGEYKAAWFKDPEGNILAVGNR